jgi:hypothetical protein
VYYCTTHLAINDPKDFEYKEKGWKLLITISFAKVLYAWKLLEICNRYVSAKWWHGSHE